jgi:predicted Fe-Mo cluster-binding NifX family protein
LIPKSHKVQKATFLKNLGIDLIICGAISRHLHQILISTGIEVIPFVHGPIGTVFDAYKNGELSNENKINHGRRTGYWCRGRGHYRRGSYFDR